MNYLSVVDELFVDRPTGAGRVAWDIALAMRDHGHQVTMLCNAAAEEFKDQPGRNVEGVSIVGYARPDTSRWDPSGASKKIRAAESAARAQLAGQPWDIVHIHTPLAGTGVIRALGNRPRYVTTVHSPVVLEADINWAAQGLVGRLKSILGRGVLERLERDLLMHSAAVHVLSEYTREQLAAIHHVSAQPSDHVVVVPHWRKPGLVRSVTKEEARKQLGWPRDARIIFTLRRHVPRMGLEVAVEALAPLAKAHRCLFIVGGDGPLRARLEAMARDRGAGPDTMIFPGRLSDPQLALAYQAADLFLLPTLALECFGLIILEAMAFGCPVMGSDVAAIPEILEGAAPDLLVPPGDPLALRNKVEAFLEGRLKVPAPEALVAYVADNFGAARVVPRIVSLLEGRA